jgi:hypothetical protein
MSQVDGPSLSSYEGKESVYVGRSVPVAAGGKLSVPIQVTAPGSIVEYYIEIKAYDLSVAITAEREEGITTVKVSREEDRAKGLTFSFWFVVLWLLTTQIYSILYRNHLEWMSLSAP